MTSDDHDFGYPAGAHGRIPSFNNVEEEAEFWDIHDFTDYLEEAKSVTVVYGGLAERLTIRLEPSDRETLANSRARVTTFTVQYETTVDTQSLPVIRYDCAHGFAHVDVLAPDGSQVSKRALPDYLTLSQAFQLGTTDIVQNWETYREHFWEPSNDDSAQTRSR